MTRLMYQLGARNNFQVFSPYEEGERPWLNTTQQQAIADWIIEKPKPLMYIRHVYHVNFRRLHAIIRKFCHKLTFSIPDIPAFFSQLDFLILFSAL